MGEYVFVYQNDEKETVPLIAGRNVAGRLGVGKDEQRNRGDRRRDEGEDEASAQVRLAQA